jgi:hypothetical protein
MKYYAVICKTNTCKHAIKLDTFEELGSGQIDFYTPPLELVRCSVCGQGHSYGSKDWFYLEDKNEDSPLGLN